MKILGKAYKENLAVAIPMAVVAVGLLAAIGAIVLDTSTLRIIVGSVFFALALVAFIFFSALIALQLMTKDAVILLDENDGRLIVNRYRRVSVISLSEIESVELRNRGLLSLSSIIFPCELSYGKIIFTLKNGKRVVTSNVVDVIETHKSILNELSVKLGADYK